MIQVGNFLFAGRADHRELELKGSGSHCPFITFQHNMTKLIYL